jgi:uncharacterized protein (TIGR00251 family)
MSEDKGRLVFLRESRDGVFMDIHVQPRAGKNGLAGIHEGLLKVRLTAPPVEGEANRECIKFFSKLLEIPKSDMEIAKGQKSRHKTILVRNLTYDALCRIFHEKGVL